MSGFCKYWTCGARLGGLIDAAKMVDGPAGRAAGGWSARRDAQIRFLKLQVEILQSRLPGNRVIPDPVKLHDESGKYSRRGTKFTRLDCCCFGYLIAIS